MRSPEIDAAIVIVEDRVNQRINFIVLTFTVVSMIISMFLGATVLYNTQAVISVRKNAADILVSRDKERSRTCLTVATLSYLLQTLQKQTDVTRKASDNKLSTNATAATYAKLANQLKAAAIPPCPQIIEP